MKRSIRSRRLVLKGMAIGGLLLALAAPALAKGTFARLTISGGALGTPQVVTDPALLGFYAFSDFSHGAIPKPDKPGPEYSITRYEQDETGKYVPWDMLRYYPSPSGGPGFVYYDGLVNGWSEYDRKWYRANPDAEAALRPLIGLPAAAGGGPAPASMPFYLVGALCLLLLGAAIAQRRAAHGGVQSHSE